MEQNLESNLIDWVAGEVCDELYEVASADTKIMVNNWCAFAVLAIYREAASILDSISVPTIDDCMAGNYEPLVLIDNPKWQQLKEWHTEHWILSQFDNMEIDYAPYIAMPELHLPCFTLGL